MILIILIYCRCHHSEQERRCRNFAHGGCEPPPPGQKCSGGLHILPEHVREVLSPKP